MVSSPGPADDTAPGRTLAQQAVQEYEAWITADHADMEILQQEFTSGPEVTQACLSCHTLAAKQFHKTIHWTWLDPNADPSERIGKAGITLNNFCISIISNWPRCTSCHAGYGWKDASFDFSDETKVDCLVCHEQTSTYKKFPTGAGHPVSKPTVFKGNGKTFNPPDWNLVAQSVARPTRQNCGNCHFRGGGGDAVKHGDLDSSLEHPDMVLDVHMGEDGKNFDCIRCHSTTAHKVAGRAYSTPAAPDRRSLLEDDELPRIMCESCHSATPHVSGSKANDHTDKVACQSCHIPTFARVIPTKMNWDWSTAGRKKEGKGVIEKGPTGKPSYHFKKGDFVWEKSVVPEYYWYNGAMQTLTAEDTIDPTRVVAINMPQGSKAEPNARIYPFKVHRGRQGYDVVNKTLLIPHLVGKKGTAAYWGSWDWNRAFTSGMEQAGLPFSGEFDWVETKYHYPTTHMVAPKENVVGCSECHSPEGRLADLSGFYMPGRDSYRLVDIIGLLMVIGSLLAVIVHGLGRLFSRNGQGG
ncbi:MAG: tetrathionate reductase family octaheme c-type cytochrome [bacterium]|nr:tetrathionate reductase family octaheme c-type cytochrome [bacterium]